MYLLSLKENKKSIMAPMVSFSKKDEVQIGQLIKNLKMKKTAYEFKKVHRKKF